MFFLLMFSVGHSFNAMLCRCTVGRKKKREKPKFNEWNLNTPANEPLEVE